MFTLTSLIRTRYSIVHLLFSQLFYTELKLVQARYFLVNWYILTLSNAVKDNNKTMSILNGVHLWMKNRVTAFYLHSVNTKVNWVMFGAELPRSSPQTHFDF